MVVLHKTGCVILQLEVSMSMLWSSLGDGKTVTIQAVCLKQDPLWWKTTHVLAQGLWKEKNFVHSSPYLRSFFWIMVVMRFCLPSLIARKVENICVCYPYCIDIRWSELKSNYIPFFSDYGRLWVIKTGWKWCLHYTLCESYYSVLKMPSNWS